MKRVIVGLVVVALGLTIAAPVVESRAWDPEHPPVWVPVSSVSDRPTGDEGSWGDPHNRVTYSPTLIDLFHRLLLELNIRFIIPSAQPLPDVTIPDTEQPSGGTSDVSGN